MNIPRQIKLSLIFVFCFWVFGGSTIHAQTTGFTYQGRLSDTNLAANGTYEMQLGLFDAVAGGNQIGSIQTIPTVSVVNGIFTVELDFGLGAFSGPDRFLEIAVRRLGDPNPHTLLTPRQPVTSAPYAIRSLNADTAINSTQLGGIDADQYVQTNDFRLSDARNPTEGSSFYVQNRTSQQLANFNISGNGTVGGMLSGNTVNSNNNYNIDGNRVLSITGTDNLFAGINAGTVNTGSGNSFFGRSAGQNNASGDFNTLIGKSAGAFNTTGNNNTFVGRNAGTTNTLGNNNTLIGAGANVLSNNLQFATAIGAGAIVGGDHVIVLGTENERTIVAGTLSVNTLSSGGAPVPLCYSLIFTGLLSNCSSSLLYKENIAPFDSGLDLINRLRPVTYNWKTSGTLDIGFIAEEVAEIEPLLATYNEKGQIEGVKYGQITTALVNAVKEQQEQIQKQQRLIERMQKLICKAEVSADICKEVN